LDVRKFSTHHLDLSSMKKPVLYFVIGMLMHTPVISQPNETDEENRKMSFSMDCPTGNVWLVDVKF
jgi:hypothetical protein